MPSINFKGKSAVWNHHLSVAYQVLEKDKRLSIKGKNENENLIIEADNLIALKSLLPKYQGQIRCIYIDPPYNIGNENWVYNDKINSPLMKDWIKKTVGADDLTRHDKWLCMMMPRLKILKELLSEEGVLFISIDDSEFASLKMILDEIFNENSIATITVENDSRSRQYDAIAVTHEYLIACSKTANFNYNQLIDENKQFQYKDSEGGFDIYELRNRNIAFNIENRPNLYYPYWVNSNEHDENGFYQISLEEKKGWIKTFPQESQGVKTVWRWGRETASKYLNKILFARKHTDGFFQIIKKYRGATFSHNSVWVDKLIKTDKGTLEIKSLFDNKKVFDYPKPVELIKRLLRIFSNPDSIILDSFAGSGTTAHAVLELNKEDGGNRKFILVQLPEEIEKDKVAYKAGFRYIHEITYERVKRAISKYKLDAGFSYMKLGSQIDAESILSGSLPTYKEFAKYIYYLATGKITDNEKSIKEKDSFVGRIDATSIYLIYEKDKNKLKNMAITLEWAENIHKKDKGKKIVYAPACFLDEEYLEKFNISFVSIPYSLFEKK